MPRNPCRPLGEPKRCAIVGETFVKEVIREMTQIGFPSLIEAPAVIAADTTFGNDS
jgi:hypothetical protein